MLALSLSVKAVDVVDFRDGIDRFSILVHLMKDQNCFGLSVRLFLLQVSCVHWPY